MLNQIRFIDAFWFWLKLGFISFGGPAGQIAIMHQELVEKKRWISEKRFLHALNFCMVLPGPEAQQLATYLGWLMHRTAGGMVAGVLFVLPSLFILIGLSRVYMTWGQTVWVSGLFAGIKPAVVAIVFHAAHRIGSKTLKNRALWSLAVISLLATASLDIPFPLLVALAAMLGLWGARFQPKWFAGAGGHSAVAASNGPALIDDDTPLPAHAAFSVGRLVKTTVAGVGLWGSSLLALVLSTGWQHTLSQMAWFFTKAALLTFGGAYAVLPYVYAGAVEDQGWLTATQMLDGLALGETTPGPLIMIVAFVGYVGAHSQAFFGADWPFLAGLAGAVVVTWFTFLPSFVFIFMGAPFIETTHNQPALKAPLTAITAAVVGVIFNLALFLGIHVWWPAGLTSSALTQPDWFALGMSALAALALFRWKRGIIETLAVCAGIGLFRTVIL